jgi:hypothetical protein
MITKGCLLMHRVQGSRRPGGTSRHRQLFFVPMEIVDRPGAQLGGTRMRDELPEWIMIEPRPSVAKPDRLITIFFG